MQQVRIIGERDYGRGVRVYLLGALPVDHGWGRWWGQDWEFRAEKRAGLQRWGVVCHVSLIHTTEEVLLQQQTRPSVEMYKVYHKDLWYSCLESSSQSSNLCWELHLARISTGCGFSLPLPSIQYEHIITYICYLYVGMWLLLIWRRQNVCINIFMLKLWWTMFTLNIMKSFLKCFSAGISCNKAKTSSPFWGFWLQDLSKLWKWRMAL